MLPFLPAHRLAARAEEQRWLVEGLWADEAVGIVGGEPTKCCKSLLALDMAVAVAPPAAPASATSRCRSPAASCSSPPRTPFMSYGSGSRAICRAAGTALANVDVQVLTAPSVRLDLESDRKALADTIVELQPRLLVLDPFSYRTAPGVGSARYVRCHRSERAPPGRFFLSMRELARLVTFARHPSTVQLDDSAPRAAARAFPRDSI